MCVKVNHGFLVGAIHNDKIQVSKTTFHQNGYNYKIKNDEKLTCLDKHAFGVGECLLSL